jgi:hypothetical protein
MERSSNLIRMTCFQHSGSERSSTRNERRTALIHLSRRAVFPAAHRHLTDKPESRLVIYMRVVGHGLHCCIWQVNALRLSLMLFSQSLVFFKDVHFVMLH